MIRRVFSLLCLLSLLVTVAAAVFWVRSYSNSYTRIDDDQAIDGRSFLGWRIYSERGRFAVARLMIVSASPRPPDEEGTFFSWILQGARADIPRNCYDLVEEPHPAAFGFAVRSETFRYGGDQPADITMAFAAVETPYWSICSLGVVMPVIWGRKRYRRRARKGYCTHCGYDLRASKERCPECGKPIASKIEGAKA